MYSSAVHESKRDIFVRDYIRSVTAVTRLKVTYTNCCACVAEYLYTISSNVPPCGLWMVIVHAGTTGNCLRLQCTVLLSDMFMIHWRMGTQDWESSPGLLRTPDRHLFLACVPIGDCTNLNQRVIFFCCAMVVIVVVMHVYRKQSFDVTHSSVCPVQQSVHDVDPGCDHVRLIDSEKYRLG
jgi:hypothetical protein